MCLQLNQQHSGWRNGITLIWSNQGPSLELRGRSAFTEAHGCMNERKVDKNLIMLRKSHAHFLNRIGVYWAELAWLNHMDGFSTTKRSSGPSTQRQGRGRWAGKGTRPQQRVLCLTSRTICQPIGILFVCTIGTLSQQGPLRWLQSHDQDSSFRHGIMSLTSLLGYPISSSHSVCLKLNSSTSFPTSSCEPNLSIMINKTWSLPL